MASLERRYGGRYRIVFCHQGRRLTHSLGAVTDREARQALARLEENLRFLERGLLVMPPDADPGVFLVSDGKLNARPVLAKPLTLGEFLARYQAGRLAGAKEQGTYYTEDIHIRHLLRILGASTPVRGIASVEMQGYVAARAAEPGRRGKRVSQATIAKEVGTLASVWNRWGVPQGLVTGPAPTSDLTYPKQGAKPPFQTREQIERKLARGGLSGDEIHDLWDSLFLTLGEVSRLLDHVRRHGHRPYAHVMFCLAAHTGARRSEILRSRIDDLDFAAETVLLREKKKDPSKQLTFRSVPMTPLLKEVLRGWVAAHPGGQYTCCTREGRPLSVQMATKAFRRAVRGSEWDVMRGWHVLRHSFVSNLAAGGVDQRMIQGWAGHLRDETTARYTHLLPTDERRAMLGVFGGGG